MKGKSFYGGGSVITVKTLAHFYDGGVGVNVFFTKDEDPWCWEAM